ncbi:MAG: DEAD/DEAH box helicase, partial [Terracidiphilus sp.]
MSTRRPTPESVPTPAAPADPLACFHPVTAAWFRAVFEAPTAPQRLGWPVIARGESALILAPTGTGKTLAAFLWCLDRLMLEDREQGSGIRDQEKRAPAADNRKNPLGCRIVYVSPLKALAVDVERNLRSPLIGMANMARRMDAPFHEPSISVRTGDTPQRERARFVRHPAEILITTPESLYLLLTSRASEALRSVETVIVDEIHSLVPTKRGAHLALSLERLQALVKKPMQRIGLSATQRPLEEVARFLGGVEVQGTRIRDQGTGNREREYTEQGTGDELAPARDRKMSGVVSDWVGDGSVTNAGSPLIPDPCSLFPGSAPAEPLRYRPVTIVNASAPKQLRLRIEVPVEDMARLGEMEEIPSGPAAQMPRRVSIWNAIHPRLLEIVRQRNSTILFVNSRQVAERLAGALNELAGESIARAHHGSLAAAQRAVIEEQLKAGKIRALCATSTLELGIDMGAVDLVIQIESPPSVASGMQRIGRAGHHVDAVSEGILFPKYRADLVACAAVTRAMHEGHIESTRFPRNPLDVLAQQLVAIAAHPPYPEIRDQGSGIGKAGNREQGTGIGKTGNKGTREQAGRRKRRPLNDNELDLFTEEGPASESPVPSPLVPSPLVPSPLVPQSLAPEVTVDFLFDLVRRAAPFGALTRSAFEGVLDLISGRYPSDEFAELRPRLNWDRIRNVVTARDGAARLAILNAGTIPDRGLYGVFLAYSEGKPVRVGELDEEMVFESHTNETFILGASTWRIVDITHDRVLVTPAPGEPGKMPFWKGDGPGRPLEFGRRIGAMVRELRALPKPAALARLVKEHDLDAGAAENLMQFLADQEAATGQVPDDRTVVIERCRDELGDWRVCVLTPFGSRIHIPWAMAVSARIRAAGGREVETLWGDDGFVLRFPDTDEPPDSDWFLVESAEAMQLVLRQLGSSALFAGRFREAAGRALLL